MVRAELFELWAPLPTAVSVAGVLAATTPSGGADPREAGCMWQVVLDAGHGGSDSGRQTQSTAWWRRSRPRTSPGGWRRFCERTATRSAWPARGTRRSPTATATHTPTRRGWDDYETVLIVKGRKDKDLAHAMYDYLSVPPAADGTGARQQQTAGALKVGIEGYLATC